VVYLDESGYLGKQDLSSKGG